MGDTLPLVVWTDKAVVWTMQFWHDNRHKDLTPELVRKLLEGAVENQ